MSYSTHSQHSDCPVRDNSDYSVYKDHYRGLEFNVMKNTKYYVSDQIEEFAAWMFWSHLVAICPEPCLISDHDWWRLRAGLTIASFEGCLLCCTNH